MGEGGARRRVPDSAGEVGSGGDDLEDSEEDPFFDSRAPAIRGRGVAVDNRARRQYYFNCPQRRGGRVPEPTRGWWWYGNKKGW